MSISSFLSKTKYWLSYGGGFKLRSYETACLEAWKQTLAQEARGLLDEQLKRLTFYQRQADEKLLCFYDMADKAAAHWPKEIFFPCRIDEIAIARLKLRAADSGSKNIIKADVILHRGRFFGLEFNKPPTPLKGGSEILKVEVLFDPMTPINNQVEQRNQLRATIDAALPVGYLDLIAEQEGVIIHGWKVYDLAHIRKVAQPDRNYYLLAEKKGKGAIAVAAEDQSGELYYLDCEDDLPVKIDTSLQSFIDRE